MVDIAHALSNKCRFAGHTREFYSVAQHAVLVSQHLPQELKLWGLLHDAGEAYFADIPNPIKREYELFSEIEDPIMRVVAEKFNLVWPMPSEVKHYDLVMLATEARDLLPIVWHDWEEKWKPMALATKIVAVSPTAAKAMFYEQYHRIID